MNKFITLELIVLAILIAYPFFFRLLKHRLKYAKFCDNLEQIAQAFICALIFKAFVAEAMVIPTGSMADTLRGTHFNIQCENCDFDYHYGFTQINAQSPPLGQLPLTQSGNYSRFPTMCTMCGYIPSPKKLRRVSNGDKIIVNKSIYQFTEPKIWDTVVFKNPTQPAINYIKRLIGTPGDKVEIIDGDVYIDSIIQSKPDHIQDELWVRIFDNNHQMDKNELRVNNRDYDQPFKANDPHSQWIIDNLDHHFRHKKSTTIEILSFKQSRLNTITKSQVAYNGQSDLIPLPYVSDLKLEAVITPKGNNGECLFNLGKYGKSYQGRIQFDGTLEIIVNETNTVVAKAKFSPLKIDKAINCSFTIVDHNIFLTVDGETIAWTGPNDPTQWGYDFKTTNNNQLLRNNSNKNNATSTVAIATNMDVLIADVSISRDIHYTTNNNARTSIENPFEPLGEDEYFVCGDNSPNSFDSRLWKKPGIGNNGKTFRTGIVPRNYMIGKAIYVWWPAGYLPAEKFPFAVIPNPIDMRFIH
jgi:signal peptidase I